jgi:hypothetical protein
LIGKKLYWLIYDLDNSERKSLHFICRNSNDKRYSVLTKLLNERNITQEEFENFLKNETFAIYPSNVSELERATKVRRLVDFCIKEIENLKISNYTSYDGLIRNYILAQVYDKTGMRHIQEDYLNKLGNDNSRKKVYLYNNFYIDTQLGLKLRTQTLKNIQEYQKLLLEKKELVYTHYLHEMVYIFDRVSALFIDDKSIKELYNDFFDDENQYRLHIALSQKKSDAAWVKLAQARFSFEDEPQFGLLITEAEKLVESLEDDNSAFVKRKIHFIKFLHGFHFNKPYAYQVEYLKKVIDYNLENDIEDPKSFFYLIFLYLLNDNKEISVLKTLLQKYKTQEEAIYFNNFIDAIIAFKKGDLKKAKNLAIETTNCKNFYFSIWAKLLEIAINYQQNNHDILESLLLSLIRQLNNNQHRIFTINSSILFVNILAEKIDMKVPKSFKRYNLQNTTLSKYHQTLLDFMFE